MHLRRPVFLSCIAGAILLAACAPVAFRQDFRGFNSAYAEVLNEQMLLNLARLDNGHPAEFLAIGTIDSRFTFSSGATGGVNSANTNTTVSSGTSSLVSKILTLTGENLNKTLSLVTGGNASVNMAASSSPEFQWIPLNNETIAKEVLQPMDTDVFYSLYQQGFPIDQLLRVMVERIETSLPGEGDIVFTNSPTRGTRESYARFLRACEMLRELQRAGALTLETSREYEPLAQFTRAQAPKSSGANSKGGAKGAGPDDSADAVPLEPTEDFQPTPEQIMSAEKDGFAWRKIREGVWELGKYQEVPRFYLKKGGGQDPRNIILGNGVIKDLDKQAIENLVMLLKDGFTVETTVRRRTSSKTCLILRSFSRALEATSVEQEGFDVLLKNEANPQYHDFFKILPFESPQCRPILRTCWDDQHVAVVRPLVKLDYAGKTYQITDPVNPLVLDPKRAPLDDSATWNRDVYRLIMALNSQVTVDISKFQRQVLELEQ